ncbi:hypothetical protein PMAYCL1PPCAC_07673, partial [Pristionchus mayeri]
LHIAPPLSFHCSLVCLGTPSTSPSSSSPLADISVTSPHCMPSLAICTLTVALCISGGFQQGYIASVLNQPYIFIEQFINDTIHERIGIRPSEPALNIIWSSLNIMFPIASIAGQFLAAWSCRKFGRKGTALLSCLLYLPGTILSSLAEPARSFELLFIGRILWSLANGVNSVNATVWIVECAPPSIRGGMAAMQEFSMAVGSLLCQSLGLPFSTPSLWPLIFLPNVPLVLIAVLLFFVVPDSPTSILEREGDMDKARSALARYYGVAVDSPMLDDELLQNKKKGKLEQHSDNKGISWIFNPFGLGDDKMKVIQQAAWLGVMVKIAYVFTGARCLRSYSTFVLHYLSHFTLDAATLGSWIISLIRIPSTLIPVFFVDRIGRRPLIIFSLIITLISLAVLITSIMVGDSMKYASFVSFAVLLLVNAAGLGSVSRFYAAELVPRSLLLEAVSILAGLEAFTKIVVEFAFFPVANVIGVYSLLIFVVPSFVFLIAIWALCPETSGRNVYQVLNDIANRKNLKVSFSP